MNQAREGPTVTGTVTGSVTGSVPVGWGVGPGVGAGVGTSSGVGASSGVRVGPGAGVPGPNAAETAGARTVRSVSVGAVTNGATALPNFTSVTPAKCAPKNLHFVVRTALVRMDVLNRWGWAV